MAASSRQAGEVADFTWDWLQMKVSAHVHAGARNSAAAVVAQCMESEDMQIAGRMIFCTSRAAHTRHNALAVFR